MRRAAPLPPTADSPLAGIGLAMLTVVFFAAGDTLTKDLTQRWPVPVIMAVRYITSLALLCGLVLPRRGRALWQTQRTALVLLRGGVLALASVTMGLALRLLPVGETVAILYLSPFAVMAIAGPLLGERVSPSAWFLAVLGFGGALLILRPGGGLEPWGVAFALMNAACATAFHLMTKVLTRTETATALLFHVTLVGAVAFGLAAIPHLGGPLPAGRDLAAMALLGMVATTGHFLFAVSYRMAPASLVAPVNYFHVVWAGLFGVLAFGHVPDGVTLAGMALIVASGIGFALTAHHLQRRKVAI